MNISGKKLTILLLEISIFFYTILILFFNCASFVFYCRVGLVTITADIILFFLLQKKIITIQTVFLLLFIFFQFGLPIVYAFDANHYNFYIELFDDNILVNAAKYTVLAIQIYIIISSMMLEINLINKKNGIINCFFEKHSREVEKAALILFCFTAIIAVPINLFSAISALMSSGPISNIYRGAMSSNGFTRFVQEFYYSSGLLYLCFSKNKFGKKMVSVLYFIVAISMIMVADRSGGVTAFIVFALYWYYSGTNKQRKKKSIILILVGVSLAIISSAIANIRLGATNQDIIQLLKSSIEEMGFNFTSLCFVMDYIPSKSKFKFGLSYFVSLILLIPKSFGLKEIYPSLQSQLGETWLLNSNKLYGRSFLDFGVGFSLIAESYYNFSWLGIFMMIPIGIVITYFLKEKNNNSWNMYVKLALMLSFFTAPRRQFASIAKSLEYSVFFTAIYLLAFIKMSFF